MSPQDVIIDMKGITKRYGYGDTESYALRDFDLTVKRGEFIMIMGPSGCGKTTLLNIIGLLDKPTLGAYFLNGKEVGRMTEQRKAKVRARKIGVIFQDFNLISHLSVLDNVTLPMTYAGWTKTHRELQADRVLEKFRLQEKEYYMPYQLSGGQQQRVAIARSLVTSPEIILADEPTGNLDSRSSHIVMEELKDIHSEGNTIIMVTHNPALTVYATRVINMLDGQIDTDIKTVEDDDLPQPVEIHFRQRNVLKEVKEALSGKDSDKKSDDESDKDASEDFKEDVNENSDTDFSVGEKGEEK
jgi:putative ABC transport system ATP-binding protein